MKKKLAIIISSFIILLGLCLGIIILLHEHTYMETVTAEATCETEGIKTFTCKCGESYTEPIPAMGHTYTDEITVEPTCELAGIKTFTCHCGDTYTEPIPAVGHVFDNYIFNDDATYLADGTETAKCNGCELTDTRTAEGSKLNYTYKSMVKTMYAKQGANVRALPCEESEEKGSLSFNEEVMVTAQCVETGWYQVLKGNISGYVSNLYLSEENLSPYLSDRNGYDVGETTTLDSGVTVKYQGNDMWKDVSSEATYKVTKELDNGGLWFQKQNPNSNSPYISERNGWNVGDTTTIDTGVTLVYQGSDTWKDVSSDIIYLATKELGNGRVWFEPQVSHSETEETETTSEPTHYADDFGYTIGSTKTGIDRRGNTIILEYLGNDRWQDQNGRTWMSFLDSDGNLDWWSFG